ncbi:MAG: Fe2+-dependent dioxygenase [Bacteroidetes bacterium]|nr:Fe2+-dependent dioxygenase [Bacteroidota bacterium]
MKTHTTYLHIPGLLNINELDDIANLSERAVYEKGKLTASDAAQNVKNNLQLSNGDQVYISIQHIILQSLNRNTLFRNAILPKQIYPFLISKYTQGMNYGYHVDSPVMGDMLRTDIAMTIFLNRPNEYEGGELELQTALGPAKFKLNAGDAICYPCSYVHRVNEVTEGCRHVAVTWIQSLVKTLEQRDILFGLSQVTESLYATKTANEELSLLQQQYSNLLRMWAN